MFNNIALCHMRLNEPREASYYLKRCLEIDPNQPKAWFRKIQLKMENEGKLQKALKMAKECLTRFETDQKEFRQLITQIEARIQKEKGPIQGIQEYELARESVFKGQLDKQ